MRQKLTRLSEETGISFRTLYARFKRGVPYDKITEPQRRGAPVKPESTYRKLTQLAAETGIPYITLYARLRKGVPYDKLTEPQRQGAPDAIAIYQRKYKAMLEKYAKTGDSNLPW